VPGVDGLLDVPQLVADERRLVERNAALRHAPLRSRQR
jgi:hypothetical protein